MNRKYDIVVSYIDIIFHYLIKDNLGFDFCEKIIAMNEHCRITSKEIKKYLYSYFKTEMGITPDDVCPLCGGTTIWKKRRWSDSYFIGCSNYPTCHFFASNEKKFTNKDEYMKKITAQTKRNTARTQRIDEFLSFSADFWYTLYLWIEHRSDFILNEKKSLLTTAGVYKRNCHITYMQAVAAIRIKTKAINKGFDISNIKIVEMPNTHFLNI